MPPNHKLTNLIRGRTVERSAGEAGKYVITFADGSALTIKSATTAPDLSGSVTIFLRFRPLRERILPFLRLDGSPQKLEGPPSGEAAVYAGFEALLTTRP